MHGAGGYIIITYYYMPNNPTLLTPLAFTQLPPIYVTFLLHSLSFALVHFLSLSHGKKEKRKRVEGVLSSG
jgi:hypothetical protein